MKNQKTVPKCSEDVFNLLPMNVLDIDLNKKS